jgi:hypothetical protein
VDSQSRNDWLWTRVREGIGEPIGGCAPRGFTVLSRVGSILAGDGASHPWARRRSPALADLTGIDMSTQPADDGAPPYLPNNAATALAEAGSGRDTPSYSWLIGLGVVVTLFVLVTAIRSYTIHVGFRDPGGQYFTRRLTGSLAVFGLLAPVDAMLRTHRRGWSLRSTPVVLRERWPAHRLVAAATGLVGYYVVYVCYHNLKSWNAFNTPRDALLRRVDNWLFLGNSPAVLLHQLLGQHWADYALTVVYQSFSAWVPLSVVVVLAFADRISDAYLFIASAVWVWVLGVASYYLIPSLGPFASAPHHFAHLPHTVVTSTQAQFMGERLYLLRHPSDGDAFSQLAAFASLHVGFTCMTLLVMRHFGFRWQSRAMAVYLGAVMVSTVYLGWHFAVDDVAGLVLAFAAVLLGRLTIEPANLGREQPVRR